MKKTVFVFFKDICWKKKILGKSSPRENYVVTFNRNMRDLLRIVPQYILVSIVLNTRVHIISSPEGKYLVCLSVSTKFSCQIKSCIFLIIFLVSPGTEALISCSMFSPEHAEQFCKHIPYLDIYLPIFSSFFQLKF